LVVNVSFFRAEARRIDILEGPMKNNSIERDILQIWEDLSGIKPIGVDDDFFEVGGDFLAAVLTLGLIREKYHVRLDMQTMFQAPTAAALARAVRAGLEKAAKLDKIKKNLREAKEREAVYTSLAPVEKKEYYTLSCSQKRFYILQQMEPGSIAYHITGLFILEGKLLEPSLNPSGGLLIYPRRRYLDWDW
jgi:hypothetical protein